LYLLAACGSSSTGETEAILVPVSNEILQDNDRLFQERQDLSNLRTAIANLNRARREFSRSYDIEWRLAKYSYYLGRHTTDQKEKTKAFDEGQAAGALAIKLDPGKPDGHFWYGANLGAQANENPQTVGVTSVKAIRESMNKVIELKPDYEMASAYDVLGQLELGTRMLGGSVEKAVELFEKGIELEKFNGETRIHLAEAYLKLNKNAEAKRQLEYILQMKPNPAYLPEYAQQVDKAKRLLETKF
jgi:tetratricopeptide (TPR) repeat protein